MTSKPVLSIKGLSTTPSDLSATPAGSMVIADNIVCDDEDIASPRRGFDLYGQNFGISSDRARKIIVYGSNMLVHTGSKLFYSTTVGGAFTQYSGAYDEPNQRITHAEMNRNLYFTSLTGIKKIDSIMQDPKDAGIPKAIHFEVSLTGTTGFLADTYSVNYKIVWGYRDLNGVLMLGAPSQVVTIKNNAGASRNVAFTIYIPSGITVNHFVQIYRSEQINGTPSLELAQVYEKTPTDAEITAKSMGGGGTVVDVSADLLRGAFLYTNPSLGGAIQANDQPPLAKTMVKFKSYVWYLNTVSKYRLKVTLLGTGSVLPANAIVRINSLVYTARSTENIGAREFQTVGGTGGSATTGSASEDIRQTALSLIRCINQDSSSTVYAYYLSDNLTTPGDILIEERGIGSQIGFGFYCSTAAFSPASTTGSYITTGTATTDKFTVDVGQNKGIPQSGDILFVLSSTISEFVGSTPYYCVNPSTSSFQVSASRGGTPINFTTNGTVSWFWLVTAKNDSFINRAYYSKSQQADAVPLLSFKDIGSNDKQIMSALSLRDSLIVMKEDGFYRISGDEPFQVDIIDTTIQLIGPDTAVVANNTIYALTNQGIVTVTEAGAEVIGLPIEADIKYLFGKMLSSIKTMAFGVAYETERKYILYLPSSITDTYCTQAYVFNTYTKTFTRWPLSATIGTVDPRTDKLLLGSSTLNTLLQETKTYSYLDYADYLSTETIISVTGKVLKMTGIDKLSVGDLIWQSTANNSYVESIDSILNTVTVYDVTNFSLGSCKTYSSIKAKIKWNVDAGHTPTNLKHYSDVSLYFKSNFAGTAKTNFESDISPTVSSVPTYSDFPIQGWGLFEWGTTPWGEEASKKPIRVIVPREHQRCSQLSVEFNHQFAYSAWKLVGISFNFNEGSTRIG